MNLAERMANLKATSNTKTYSDTAGSLPLSVFLTIYEKSQYECYVNYMEGARALHSYLSSNNTCPLTMHPSDSSPPRMLRTYELHELTKIIAGSSDLNHMDIVERSIYREVR